MAELFGSVNREQLARLAAILLIAANAALFVWNQVQQGSIQEQQLRLSQLEAQSMSMLRGRNDPISLRNDINSMQDKIKTAGVAFPGRIDVVAIQDHVVQTARRNAIQIFNLTLLPDEKRSLGGIQYPVVIVSVEGYGDLNNLYSFIGQAQKSLYNTSSIENIRMAQKDGTWTTKFLIVAYRRP